MFRSGAWLPAADSGRLVRYVDARGQEFNATSIRANRRRAAGPRRSAAARAGGAGSYARAARVLALPLAKLVYGALIVAFSYHLIAGLRHLIWDTGHALERAQSQRSAWLVVTVSLVLMLVIAWRVWLAGAHAP